MTSQHKSAAAAHREVEAVSVMNAQPPGEGPSAPIERQLQDVDNSELADRINAAHREAEALARTAVAKAIECGELLNEAKSRLQHGEWQAWVEKNTSISMRTVQRYMTLAGKNDIVSHLPSVAAAFRHLAELECNDLASSRGGRTSRAQAGGVVQKAREGEALPGRSTKGDAGPASLDDASKLVRRLAESGDFKTVDDIGVRVIDVLARPENERRDQHLNRLLRRINEKLASSDPLKTADGECAP